MSISDSTTPLKHCNVCRKPYPPTTEFWHVRRASADGLSYTCKACSSEKSKRYYSEHRHQINANVKLYSEQHADEKTAYLSEYYLRNKAKMNTQGRANRARNRDAYDQRVKTWIAEHPERRREIANRYGKTPKGIAARLRRRARERNLVDNFTAVEWQACLSWWHDSCAYCGEQQKLSADHFIPLASPDCPGTVAENMLPSCKRCNSSKQHRDPVEWLVSRYSEPEYLEILAQIAAYFDIL